MQRNWIGRSEGAEFDLVVDGRDGSDGRERLALRVFTTRPDTSFGMTYAVVAPEHPLVDALTTPEHRAEVDDLRARAAASTDVERMSESGADEPRQARCVHRLVGDQPVHRPAGAGLRGRLRADGLRHRRHHGGARRRHPRLGLRPGLRIAGRTDRQASRGWDEHGVRMAARVAPTPAPARRSTANGSTGWTFPRPRPGPSSGWRPRASASAPSTTGCATG